MCSLERCSSRNRHRGCRFLLQLLDLSEKKFRLPLFERQQSRPDAKVEFLETVTCVVGNEIFLQNFPPTGSPSSFNGERSYFVCGGPICVHTANMIQKHIYSMSATDPREHQ